MQARQNLPGTMPMHLLTVRHITAYRYRQPVSFGEHRMMLRPRDSYDQKLIEARLEITPEPASLATKLTVTSALFQPLWLSA